MMTTLKKVMSAVLLAAAAMTAPAMVGAKEITLIFEGQGITLVGEFAGFKDGAYIIVNNNQELYVPAVLVRCEGDDCFEVVTAQVAQN
jgi:hypothetical protein